MPAMGTCTACQSRVAAGLAECPVCGATFVEEPPARPVRTAYRRTAPAQPIPNVSRAAAVIAAVAGLLIIIGSITPWATVSSFVSISVNGTNGDGKVTLVLGIALLLCAAPLMLVPLTGYWDMAIEGLCLIGCLVCFAIAAYDGKHISDNVSAASTSSFVTASVGTGIYLIVVASIAGSVFLFVSLAVASRAPRS